VGFEENKYLKNGFVDKKLEKGYYIKLVVLFVKKIIMLNVFDLKNQIENIEGIIAFICIRKTLKMNMF